MSIKERIEKGYVFVDGAMGTMLQDKGLELGEKPEIWNLTHPDVVKNIHKDYLLAGADVVTANTFGCNVFKFEDRLEDVTVSAIRLAKEAIKEVGHGYVALDIGPTGKLLKPLGDLAFEDAIAAFKKTVEIGVKEGVDLIIIETMNDLYELKAAVIATKECCSLPIFATVVLDENGRLMTGGDVTAVVALLEGLGVTAVGFNCGIGGETMFPFIKQLVSICSTPMLVSPNAGLPMVVDGKVVYTTTPSIYADIMTEFAALGVTVLGGCCGTTPNHIKAMVEKVKNIPFRHVIDKGLTLVSSQIKGVIVNKGIAIGERINPTGKPLFKEALRKGDIAYALRVGIEEESMGADILDVNVGLAEIDEKGTMCDVVEQLQGVVSIPLQIDTTKPDVLEAAMRIVGGKPIINSVNGKLQIMKEVFPLVKKYGGVVVGLTLDENGIPDKPEERVKIAKRIVDTAEAYGISKKDIIIDPLTMTIATDRLSGDKTLTAVKMLADMDIKTVLGISNISFGMPNREKINQRFLALAVENGLNAAIINPNAVGLIDTLKGNIADDTSGDFADFAFSLLEDNNKAVVKSGDEISLFDAIVKGLGKDAMLATERLIDGGMDCFDIIDNYIIKALNVVGDRYEKKTIYLPQLLMSADSAKGAFYVINKVMQKLGNTKKSTSPIVLATVQGDIHDIGKNIVRVLLENYGYDVIDLGKDVAPEKVVKAAIAHSAKLVGLSALMTTTVVSMEKTIAMLKEKCPDVKTVVGGAVLTAEYARQIGADFYAKDAMETVRVAETVLK